MVVFLGGRLFSGVAEAGDFENLDERIAAVTTSIAMATTDMGLLIAISNTLEEIFDMQQDIKALDDRYYELDHEALEEVVFNDWTAEAENLYAGLASSGALAFASSLTRDMFEAQNPGYRITPDGSYINFAQAYKDRIEEWQDYLHGVFEANNTQAAEIEDSQETIAELKRASLGAKGYRQVMQAGQQITVFVNQELSKLRVDLERQLEAETKYALNEQQEKADAAAAFEGAVKTWRVQSGGRIY
jgi:P-type conjugative transfer protein TrbJ